MKKTTTAKINTAILSGLFLSFVLSGCERVDEIFPEASVITYEMEEEAAADESAKKQETKRSGDVVPTAETDGKNTVNSPDTDKKAEEKATASPAVTPSASPAAADLSTLLSAEDAQKAINKALPGIVCWGDSITYGYLSGGANYPDTLRERIDREFIAPIREQTGFTSLQAPVVLNFGVSAEKTSEITGRAGGDPYLLGESIVIPADTKPVTGIWLKAKDGTEIRPLQEVTPLRAGVPYRFGAEYYTIGGVTGKLERYYDEAADRSRYQFTRLSAGKEVRIDTGTPFVPDVADGRYRGYIGIVLMGANGGYKDDAGEDLAAQFRSVVSGYNNYLCIGMSRAGIRTAAGDLDPSAAPALKRNFGERFLSIQELLNGNDNPDTTIPQYLLAPDGLHYTDEGYTEIGNRIFEKLDSLGYFDELKMLSSKSA